MSPSYSQAALDILTKKKVHVILNDKVEIKNFENFKSNKLKSQNGKEIEFDAYFVCVGAKPCTDMVIESFPEWVDEHGFIKVDGHLNVITSIYESVFFI